MFYLFSMFVTYIYIYICGLVLVVRDERIVVIGLQPHGAINLLPASTQAPCMLFFYTFPFLPFFICSFKVISASLFYWISYLQYH